MGSYITCNSPSSQCISPSIKRSSASPSPLLAQPNDVRGYQLHSRRYQGSQITFPKSSSRKDYIRSYQKYNRIREGCLKSSIPSDIDELPLPTNNRKNENNGSKDPSNTTNQNNNEDSSASTRLTRAFDKFKNRSYPNSNNNKSGRKNPFN